PPATGRACERAFGRRADRAPGARAEADRRERVLRCGPTAARRRSRGTAPGLGAGAAPDHAAPVRDRLGPTRGAARRGGPGPEPGAAIVSGAGRGEEGAAAAPAADGHLGR